MDTTRIKKITGFLTAQIYKSPEEDTIRQFVLFHSKPGGVLGRQIDSYTPSELNKPDDIAKEILFAAQGDADVYPLIQHYVIMAYRESDLENAVGSMPFKLRPKQQAGESDHSEPPTKDGLTAQLMRHLETVNQNQAAWQQGVFQQVLKFVSLQSDELARYRQLNHEVHEAREQLMLERVSVQHAANLREIEDASGVDETKKIIAETAAKYLPMAMPAIINGVTQMVNGKQPQLSAPVTETQTALPASTPEENSALPFDVGPMLAAMSDEQKQAVLANIVQHLSPEEIKNLGQLFMMVSADNEPEKPIEEATPTKKKTRKKSARKSSATPVASENESVDHGSEAN